MYVIGLTGNIAVGKTTVCNILRTLGAQIIDADLLVRRILAMGHPVHDQVVAAFGAQILTENGEIDRARLGRLVFADPGSLRRLEAITHPAVDVIVQHEIASSQAEVVVVDAVKLLESGIGKRCNAIWVVIASEEQQFERLTRRRGMTEADAWQRIHAQASQAEKVRQADVVIDNSGSVDQTDAQVRHAWALIPRQDQAPTARR
jgi:dephospho-CoA kinase